MRFFCVMLTLFLCASEALFANNKNVETEQTNQKKTVEKTSTTDKGKKEKEKKEKEEKEKKASERPWFMGTLLAIFPENIAPQKFLFETTWFHTRFYGAYGPNSSLIQSRNVHADAILFLFETGITKDIDVAITFTETYARASEGVVAHLGDIYLQFGFQVARDKKGSWIPDIRVLAGSLFPTGKFENLNPLLMGADISGGGAFAPFLGLVIQKIFYNIPCHPYSINFNFLVFEHSSVHVHGANIFGGAPGTRGVVHPGEDFIFNLAYEFKFNKHWGWGVDLHYTYQNRSSFHNEGGDVSFPGAPSSNVFSVAPEIEYNLSASVAIEFALWYSLLTRNSLGFFGSALLFSYMF